MSCRDVASILWDFYPTLGCHGTQNVLHKCNHPTKPITLIYVWMVGLNHFSWASTYFQRLTSNQMICQLIRRIFVWRHTSPSISPGLQWAGTQKETKYAQKENLVLWRQGHFVYLYPVNRTPDYEPHYAKPNMLHNYAKTTM